MANETETQSGSTGGRFHPRPTTLTGVSQSGAWQLKHYEITPGSAAEVAPITDAVRAAAHRRIAAATPTDPGDVGVGFTILHPGAERVWLLLDLWRGDILHHQLFRAPLASPDRFTAVPAGGPTACVWELVVIAHERDAFVRHILDPVGGPDRVAYLADAVQVTA